MERIAYETGPHHAGNEHEWSGSSLVATDTETTMRRALRDAVLSKSPRGEERVDETPSETWSALVLGRWSAVARFEHEGRVYVVVRLADARELAESLRPREREVAFLASRALSNKVIAAELGVAESTVATHLRKAMAKLGVGSRAELVGLLTRAVRASRSALDA